MTEVIKQGVFMGYKIQTPDVLVFFGSKEAPLEEIKKEFPQIEFRFLKQVHGDNCVESSSEAQEPEADAHHTEEKRVALCIRTADCMPIMVWNSKRILAIHAGWRGVYSNIFQTSVSELDLGSDSSTRVAVGPHIQKQSFEVDRTLADQFIAGFGKDISSDSLDDPKKSYLNLARVIVMQSEALGMNPQSFTISSEDTLNSQKWHSFRRDGSYSGRNISFVARL